MQKALTAMHALSEDTDPTKGNWPVHKKFDWRDDLLLECSKVNTQFDLNQFRI